MIPRPGGLKSAGLRVDLVTEALARQVTPTGLFAVNAILAALRHRDVTGRGQRVDVPMFETMAHFVLIDHFGGLMFEPPLDHGGYARLLAPERRPYRTKDGYLCALIYNDKQWRSFFHAIGRPDMEDDRFRDHASRIRHIREIYAEVSR